MEVIVDKNIIKSLLSNLLKVNTDLLTDPKNKIGFRWPTFLKYLDIEPFSTDFPIFDEANVIFQASLDVLHTWKDNDTIFHMYDRLFAEILSLIKALPQIDPNFLLEAAKKRPPLVPSELEKAMTAAFAIYEKALVENTYHTMHDLILYLGYDRICVWIAHLFDYPSSEPKFIRGIKVLKECLIESYLHISNQGRTFPSIYRLFETLVFYNMREDVLNQHTPDDWAILSQSFSVLKGDRDISDVFYIDDAVLTTSKLKTYPECCYLTLNNPDEINLQHHLAKFMLKKLAIEFPDWNYKLQEQKIISAF